MTTFLTMSYILFVNPQILSKVITVPNAFTQILFATALASCVGSIVMGVVARYPFALGAGDGAQRLLCLHRLHDAENPMADCAGRRLLEALMFMVLSVGGDGQAIVSGIPGDQDGHHRRHGMSWR